MSKIVDVLASSPTEINQIAERLKQPSPELVKRVAEWFPEILKGLEFRAVENLGYVHYSVNKARRFSNPEDGYAAEIVLEHLHEVSQAFPTAIFLIEDFDFDFDYSRNLVMRGGEVVRHITDYHKAPDEGWALLDIFAPYRLEYRRGLEFGSMWNRWVGVAITTAKSLTPDADASSSQ